VGGQQAFAEARELGVRRQVLEAPHFGGPHEPAV
jgi:hypothetical protein